ncbi:hypothetical protein [Chloroflexus aurantiacus]
MPPKPSPATRLPPGRGRAPAPWTIWEIMAITVSVLMIVVPLTLEGLNWIRPPVAPAQELMAATETPVSLEQRPPTFTPLATATPGSPVPTDTLTPTNIPTGETVTPTNTPTGETVTPTNTSLPTLTPSPTPGTTRVNKFASLSTVNIGQSFSYSLAVTTQSDSPITLTLRDVLDANLELVEASAFGGTCFSGQTVLCTLTVSRFNPASVTLQVRVRSSATEGLIIPNQAVLEQGSLQVGVSNVVNVTVAGQPVPTIVPTETPIVTATATATATATNTPTATSVTPTPVSTTSTPTVTNTPVAQPTSSPRPTSPPPPPRPTSPPPAPTSPPTPTAPPPPVVLPTEPPPPAPVATVAPRPTATPRPRPPAPPTNTPTPAASPTPTEPPAPAAFAESDLLLRLASDWGSAYAGQDIVFTIVLGNTHPAQTVSAVSLRSVMPSNLQVLGANASRGADPTINGQTVTYLAPDLAPGERVEVTIATRIRSDVAAGTLLVVQAQANQRDLSRPVFSNISTVLVVGGQQVATATATRAPATLTATVVSPTAGATTTSAPATATATATPDIVLGGGAPPAATTTPTTTPPAAGGASGGQAPLPNTSAGIPFLGVLLLGATLLTRTIRLHRARERI